MCLCFCVLHLCKCERCDNSVWACCAHAVWEHRSAFTGTDPQGQGQIDGQMERQSIISSLVQRFSNLFVPNEQHIDPAFLVPLHQSLTQKHTKISWECAVIGNDCYISDTNYSKIDSRRKSFHQKCNIKGIQRILQHFDAVSKYEL